MNASKEEATTALNEIQLVVEALGDIVEGTGNVLVSECVDVMKRRLSRVENFLKAARRKLPYAKSFKTKKKI